MVICKKKKSNYYVFFLPVNNSKNTPQSTSLRYKIYILFYYFKQLWNLYFIFDSNNLGNLLIPGENGVQNNFFFFKNKNNDTSL